VTATDEIIALAAAADAMVSVTEPDVAAFVAAAARGQGGAVVRALLAIRPPAEPAKPPAAQLAPPYAPLSALLPGDPAWAAWLTAAAAAGDGATDAGERAAVASGPVWCAVFGAAVALAGRPGSAPPMAAVTAAIAAGLDAAAIVESGLADWGSWSPGSVAATVGAGLAAGLLLGLTEPQLRAAIGICATQAAGLRAAQGTDAFPLQAGKAAFNGVEAAQLARAGLTAPAEPLDGRRGLFALFGAQAPPGRTLPAES
jgi:2-methylcitrate dehydratase PrpD